MSLSIEVNNDKAIRFPVVSVYDYYEAVVTSLRGPGLDDSRPDCVTIPAFNFLQLMGSTSQHIVEPARVKFEMGMYLGTISTFHVQQTLKPFDKTGGKFGILQSFPGGIQNIDLKRKGRKRVGVCSVVFARFPGYADLGECMVFGVGGLDSGHELPSRTPVGDCFLCSMRRLPHCMYINECMMFLVRGRKMEGGEVWVPCRAWRFKGPGVGWSSKYMYGEGPPPSPLLPLTTPPSAMSSASKNPGASLPEDDFEFVETPHFPSTSPEEIDCGVRTTSVGRPLIIHLTLGIFHSNM